MFAATVSRLSGALLVPAFALGLTACAEPGAETEVGVQTDSLRSSDGSVADVVAADPSYSTLLAAVQYAGLVDALSDSEAELTLLAPNDAAFEATLSELGLTAADLLTEENKGLLTDILLYHVVPSAAPSAAVRTLDGGAVGTLQGDEIDINVRFRFFIQLNGDAYVTDPDNYASNGVVHGINRVLLPPGIFGGQNTVYDRLAADDRFSTLVAAIDFAGLDEALDDPEAHYTLLAPDNRAFQRSLDALGLTAEALLTEENKALVTDILLYHVLDGELRSGDVRGAAGTAVPTLQGEAVDIGLRFGFFITLNGNTFVRRADTDTTNGVIHTISGVLLPPSSGL